jgi:hypothetical protein
MIQINLVPDIKQEMIHAQRMRNVAISFSIIAGFVAGAVVLVLALILGSQAVYEAATASRIDSEYKKLAATKDINAALTIQNQLSQVSTINGKKSVDSRLLDVIAAINPPAPNDVKLSKVTLDPTERKLTLEGSAAGGYTATEVFRKTILNTKVISRPTGQTGVSPTEQVLTDLVTLQDTSYGQDASGQRVVRFVIVFVYPEGLFDNTTSDVQIKTPDANTDVTDSKARVPDSLFSAPVTSEEEGQ